MPPKGGFVLALRFFCAHLRYCSIHHAYVLRTHKKTSRAFRGCKRSGEGWQRLVFVVASTHPTRGLMPTMTSGFSQHWFRSLLVLALIIPQVAFAAWWNPFSWKIFSWLPWVSETATYEVERVNSPVVTSASVVESGSNPAATTTVEVATSSVPDITPVDEQASRDDLADLKEQLRLEAQKREELEKEIQSLQNASSPPPVPTPAPTPTPAIQPPAVATETPKTFITPIDLETPFAVTEMV